MLAKRQKDFMKITPRQFSEYFKAKGASEHCPFCSKDMWSLPALSDDPKTYGEDEIMEVHESHIGLFKPGEHNVFGGPYVPVLAVTCMNCGFVRYQHMFPIQHWLEESGAKNE